MSKAIATAMHNTSLYEPSLKSLFLGMFSYMTLVDVISNPNFNANRIPLATSSCTNDSEILKYLLKNYNKDEIPGDGPLEVEVQVWVQNIRSISDITQDFHVDIYMNEIWIGKPCV